MGKVWKIIGSILAVAVISGFGFCTVWTVRNWNVVYKSLDGSSVYTNQDIKNSYQDGYNEAAKNEEEDKKTIADLRDLITNLQIDKTNLNNEIKELNENVVTLNNHITVSENTIAQLNNQKLELQERVSELQNIKSQNNATINRLNTQIDDLRTTVSSLENNKSQNETTIKDLKAQITSLQTTVTQLQNTNQVNTDTITALNAQIVTLNDQIRTVSASAQNANAQIAVLTNRINELQSTVTYYENYLSTVENEAQAVATYEVDGAVAKIEIVDKGSEITLTTMPNANRYIFNGWKVNGEGDLLGETYVLNNNTKFVADLTYRYEIKFVANRTVGYIHIENETLTSLPDTSVTNKTGYRFVGWSLDGVNVIDNDEILQTPITANTTYYAVYIKTYTVTYQIQNGSSSTYKTYYTKVVDSGSYTPACSIPPRSGYKVLGWSIDQVNVIENIDQVVVVTADTTYYALYAKQHTVKYVDTINNSTYTERVYNNEYPTYKYTPNPTGYKFLGWSVDKVEIIDNLNETPITADTTFYTMYAKEHTVTFTYNNGTSNVTSTQKVYNGEYADSSKVTVRVTNGTFVGWMVGDTVVGVSDYKILSDTTFTGKIDLYDWQVKQWTNATSITAKKVWSDGEDTYYSTGSTQLKLNKETQQFEAVTWNGYTSIDGEYVVRVGNDIYYVYRAEVNLSSTIGKIHMYQLNKATSTWTLVTFNIYRGNYTGIALYGFWSDGVNFYYSALNQLQLKLNKTTATFEQITWSGLTNFSGNKVYYDNNGDCYCDNYKLKKNTTTWETATFSVDANTWTDGSNYYRSSGETHTKYNNTTGEWENTTWTGLTNFNGSCIWTDGDNIYYSSGSTQYVLNRKVA